MIKSNAMYHAQEVNHSDVMYWKHLWSDYLHSYLDGHRLQKSSQTNKTFFSGQLKKINQKRLGGDDESMWYECDIESVTTKLLDVHDNYEKYLEFAKKQMATNKEKIFVQICN